MDFQKNNTRSWISKVDFQPYDSLADSNLKFWFKGIILGPIFFNFFQLLIHQKSFFKYKIKIKLIWYCSTEVILPMKKYSCIGPKVKIFVNFFFKFRDEFVSAKILGILKEFLWTKFEKFDRLFSWNIFKSFK